MPHGAVHVVLLLLIWRTAFSMPAAPIDMKLQELTDLLSHAIEQHPNETLGSVRVRRYFQRELDLRARLPDLADRFASMCSRKADLYGETEVAGAIAAVRRELAFDERHRSELEAAFALRVNHQHIDVRVDSYLMFLEEPQTCESLATVLAFRLCSGGTVARVMERHYSRGFHSPTASKEDHDAIGKLYQIAVDRGIHATSDGCVFANYIGTFGAEHALDEVALHEALDHELALWGITLEGNPDELDEVDELYTRQVDLGMCRLPTATDTHQLVLKWSRRHALRRGFHRARLASRALD